jgi:hypothetical protein
MEWHGESEAEEVVAPRCLPKDWGTIGSGRGPTNNQNWGWNENPGILFWFLRKLSCCRETEFRGNGS